MEACKKGVPYNIYCLDIFPRIYTNTLSYSIMVFRFSLCLYAIRPSVCLEYANILFSIIVAARLDLISAYS